MFQDISPHTLHIEYATRSPLPQDTLILLSSGKVLMKENGQTLPSAEDIGSLCPEAVNESFYLFSIDDRAFFFSPLSIVQTDTEKGQKESREGTSVRSADLNSAGFSYHPVMTMRDLEDRATAFGAALSSHLGLWYMRHRFCGCCGKETIHSGEERAIICPHCGQIYYPRISPVVIIAIVNGDSILLTRYSAGGYRRHALVAGFVEAGETLEDAVRREIMEEVGLKVKNIRYCESQPWPFSSSLIAGFFADLDGDPGVHLNTDGKDELSEAVWVRREDLRIEDSSVSLTWDMIRKFRDGQNP